MMRHAQADNARLLKVFPKGFALDAHGDVFEKQSNEIKNSL
jgi:hypothetical protein